MSSAMVRQMWQQPLDVDEVVRQWVELELAWALTSSVEPFISPLLNEYVRRVRHDVPRV